MAAGIIVVGEAVKRQKGLVQVLSMFFPYVPAKCSMNGMICFLQQSSFNSVYGGFRLFLETNLLYYTLPLLESVHVYVYICIFK